MGDCHNTTNVGKRNIAIISLHVYALRETIGGALAFVRHISYSQAANASILPLLARSSLCDLTPYNNNRRILRSSTVNCFCILKATLTTSQVAVERHRT